VAFAAISLPSIHPLDALHRLAPSDPDDLTVLTGDGHEITIAGTIWPGWPPGSTAFPSWRTTTAMTMPGRQPAHGAAGREMAAAAGVVAHPWRRGPGRWPASMTTHHRSLRFVSLARLSANAEAKVERGARAGAGSGLVVEYRGQLDTQPPSAGCVMRSPSLRKRYHGPSESGCRLKIFADQESVIPGT
jgi:hypothetical protein